MTDNVNHPKHYEGSTSLECIDVMRLVFGNQDVARYALINAFKYLWRHRNKGGLEDIRKSEWYMEKATDLDSSLVYRDIWDVMRELQVKAEKEYNV